MFNHFQSTLKNTVVGNMFFLQSSLFRRSIEPQHIYRYSEVFTLGGNKFRGEFLCNIGNKNGVRESRLWNYSTILKIYNNTFSREELISEEFKIRPRTMSVKDIPEVNHRLVFEKRIALLEDLPREIISLIKLKSDKDIISYKTN